MSEVKWIKIVTDIFDDEKILLIEGREDADSIIVCWFKLLCLAGKTNNSGVLFLTDKIPYTDEMLASIFRRPLETVRHSLTTFEEFGMIEIINGVITIPNWGKHQEIDGLERAREKTRERVSRFRERQKQISDCNVTANVTVTPRNGVDKEVDIEVEQEIDNEYSMFETVISAWNEIGINAVRSIVPQSERAKLLKARVKEQGFEAVLEAIAKVKDSDFLRGQNKNGWTITFDWFIRPRNFQKVLEGNYDRRDSNGSRRDTRSVEDSSKKWNIRYD